MTVALLFRGPIRPDVDAVAANMRMLLGEFAERGVACDVFLATWAGQDAPLDALLAEWPGMTTLLLRQPGEETILPHVENRHGLAPRSVRNAFWQYYMSKIAIDLICSVGGYDHVVHTRTDLAMRLGGHFGSWFDDCYNTLHLRVNGVGFINDQFAVAPAEAMRRAWDHRDKGDLLRMLADVDKPEEVLHAMVERAGVATGVRPYEFWQLDGRRHEAPPTSGP